MSYKTIFRVRNLNSIIENHLVSNIIDYFKIYVDEGFYCLYIKNNKIIKKLYQGQYISIRKNKNNLHLLYININNKMTFKYKSGKSFEVFDPLLEIFENITIQANYYCLIKDSNFITSKIFDINNDFTIESFANIFSSIIETNIKALMSSIMIKERISLFNINANLQRISKQITLLLKNNFLKYGITLNDFIINNIIIPEENKNKIAKLYLTKYPYSQEKNSKLITKELDDKNAQQNFIYSLIKNKISSND